MNQLLTNTPVAVVIPCYKVKSQVLKVIATIDETVQKIYVIDDACPEETGKYVQKNCTDKRVQVLYNSVNLGVGGAVMVGYKAAITEGMKIVVKIDGDGQMDGKLLALFIQPIIDGEADYTKGNRFFDLEGLENMPKIRLLGNAILSLMSKLSTGYWNLFDSTNGYTAIHSEIIKKLPLNKISHSYFFETDILFRLNIIKAVVIDIPMNACYSNESSNLKIRQVLSEFLYKHLRNFIKRIFYNYYLRDISLASIQLPLGLLLLLFGSSFGIYHWIISGSTGLPASTGTVMISALCILLGMQFVLAFLSYDINQVPIRVRHKNS